MVARQREGAIVRFGKETGSGAAADGAVVDLVLVGQVGGRLYRPLQGLHREESSQVGRVGGDHD